MEPSSPTFSVRQARLPGMLGISIEEVRLRRDKFLEKGADWEQRGNTILYTSSAVQTLLKTLGVPVVPDTTKNAPADPAQRVGEAVTGPVSESGQGPAPEPALPVLRVHRSAPHIRNRYIVEVVQVGIDNPQVELLWVRDNTVFKPDLIILPTSLQARQPGQYTYIGRMPPR